MSVPTPIPGCRASVPTHISSEARAQPLRVRITVCPSGLEFFRPRAVGLEGQCPGREAGVSLRVCLSSHGMDMCLWVCKCEPV